MPDLAPALSIPLAVLAILAAAGAWLDWRYRLLPNWLCAIVLAAGLGLVLAREPAPAVVPHLTHAAVALLVGMALFAGGLIGGGDAKFYSALAAWFPLSDGFRLLLLVGLAGMVLTIGMWATVWRRKADRPVNSETPGPFRMVLPLARVRCSEPSFEAGVAQVERDGFPGAERVGLRMKWTRIAAGWVAGVMDWWMIRIEPVPLPQRVRAVGPCYEFCLPLIADGRISMALFRSEPGRATFHQARKGTTSLAGQIEYRDNQWICVYRRRSPVRAEVRIMCRRFAVGDLVGLRSAGDPIAFYRVKRKELVLPASGG